MTAEFDKISERIRTLTTVLGSMKARSDPTSNRRVEIPKFLHHFVTLLTRGDKHTSPCETKGIAATGTLGNDGTARTLIVTQNPYPKSSVSTLNVTQIYKADKSFHDVVKGPPDPNSFADHIADIWTAVEKYDRGAPGHQEDYRALRFFVVMRSFRKLSARFHEDRRLFKCGDRLFGVLENWQPHDPELEPRWIPIPPWLNNIHPTLMPETGIRVEGGQLHWMMSKETLSLWASLLAMMLMELNEHIGKAEFPMNKKCTALEDSQRSAAVEVNAWCNLLYHFVFWDQKVVQFLLEKTSLAQHLQNSMHYMEATEEDDLNITPELNERAGTTVFRYLKAVLAWNSALNHLTATPFAKQVVTNLIVGLVEVPPGGTSMLAADELIEMYRSRDNTEDDVEQRVGALRKHYKSSFSGTVHAEASLMGLLAYERYNERCKYGVEIEKEGILGELLGRELDAVDTIAVSKKCCWCCDRLATHLEYRLHKRFELPGTNGLLSAWSPPAVGVDVQVLEALEGDLWNLELLEAVAREVVPIISCQSSPSGTITPGSPPDDWRALSGNIMRRNR